MSLRARLLDMGEVAPLRAHSLRLALAEGLDSAAAPAVLVARTVSPAVILGEDRSAAGEVDLAACRAGRVPVLRLPGSAPPRLIRQGSLVVSLALPAARVAGSALPMDDADCRAWLAGAVATAGVDGERAMCEVDTAGQGLVLTVFVGFGDEERLAALLPGRSTAVVEAGGSASAAEQSPAEIAESVLNALEERAGLELVPSMPTPEELESVYEWDRRLAARVESEAVTPAAGTAA